MTCDCKKCFIIMETGTTYEKRRNLNRYNKYSKQYKKNNNKRENFQRILEKIIKNNNSER